jgi:hypothetical protein
VTSPRRTRSAWAVASRRAMSVNGGDRRRLGGRTSSPRRRTEADPIAVAVLDLEVATVVPLVAKVPGDRSAPRPELRLQRVGGTPACPGSRSPSAPRPPPRNTARSSSARAGRPPQPRATLVRLEDVNHVLKSIASMDLQAQISTYRDPSMPLAPSSSSQPTRRRTRTPGESRFSWSLRGRPSTGHRPPRSGCPRPIHNPR